jgi:hypothetical protein
VAELAALQEEFEGPERVLRRIPDRLAMCRRLVELERRVYHLASDVKGPDPLPADGPCLRLLGDEVALLQRLEDEAEADQDWGRMRMLRGAKFEIERIRLGVDLDGITRLLGISPGKRDSK